jgi:porin
LFGWEGGTAFINFQNVNGEFGSSDSGDIQNVDSIASDGRTQISELWYEQFFLDSKLHIRIGKINSSGEFNVTANAVNFVNASMTQSPTILAFPAYPDPAFGLEVLANPTENFYARAGIYDGALQEGIETGRLGPATLFGPPADLFLIAETGLKWQMHDVLPGKLGVGAWHDTGRFNRFEGGHDRGTSGFYLVADQSIFRVHPKNKNDPQGIDVFFRYGWANPQLSPIEHHIAGGLAWTGPIPKRNADVLGVGAECALLSGVAGAGFDDRAETTMETFYKIQITPFFSVQPDVQYIVNPSGLAQRDNALMAILRMSVDF